MPTDIATTATETFDTVINAPAGGDPRTAASVRVMGQALADQTLWTWRRLQMLLGSFCPIGAYAPAAITGVDTGTDELTLVGHGINNNDPVRFVAATSGTLPGGLSENTVYYTIKIDADTIQVSTASGPGSAVDITSNLSGDVYVAKITDPQLMLPTVGGITAGKLSAILARFGLLSGTNAWSGANTFDDITVSSGNNYKVSSRSITRVIDDAPVYIATGTTFSADNHGVFTDAGTSGPDILWPLLIPHGQVLTSVSVSIEPNSGHGGLPANMPRMDVIKRDLVTSTASSIAFKVDASGSTGAYETAHSLTPTSFSETVDRSTYAYYVKFISEYGVNSVSSLKILGVSYTVTLTSIGQD